MYIPSFDDGTPYIIYYNLILIGYLWPLFKLKMYICTIVLLNL